MEIRFNLNPDALPTLRKLARKLSIESDNPSDLLKQWLHRLTDTSLPARGGSKGGQKLNITEEGKEARRLNAEKARNGKKKTSPP